jgi:hypothetical protein
MEFQIHGRRFLVNWEHVDDNRPVAGDNREKAADVLARLRQYPGPDQKERGVPQGRATYDGVTVCRIRTLKDDADKLPPAERWMTVAEGYSFKRASDVGFNKKISRKNSLFHALSSTTVWGRFSQSDRETIWAEFLKLWPTVRPGANAAEKTIAKLRIQLKASEAQVLELMSQLKDRVKA